jgi:hypothetical protein
MRRRMRHATAFVLAVLLTATACSDDTASDAGPSSTASTGGSDGGSGGAGGSGGSTGPGGMGGLGAGGGGGSGPCALGTTWEVIDDFTDSGVGPAQAGSVAADSEGNLYVAGTAGAQGMERWLVRKSSDGGAGWITVMDVAQGSGAGLALDGAVVYAAGAQSFAGVAHRMLRRSADGGATWEVLDDFSYDPQLDSYGGSVAVDSGTIYTLGQSGSLTGARTVLRKSTDAGTSWTTTLDQQLAPNKVCVPRGLAMAPNGDVYVGTRCVDAGDVPHWLVLRGAEGEQWTVADDIASAQGWNIFVGDAIYTAGTVNPAMQPSWVVRRAGDGRAFTSIHDLAGGRGGSVYVDGAGVIVITGGLEASPMPQVVTRRSDDGGASWQQIDDWAYGAGVYAGDTNADPEGNLYQPGLGFDPNGITHWLVRKMACR